MERMSGRERRAYDLEIWRLTELNKQHGRLPNEHIETLETIALITEARDMLEKIRVDNGYSKVQFATLLGIKSGNYDKYLNPDIKSDLYLSTLVKLFGRLGYKPVIKFKKS